MEPKPSFLVRYNLINLLGLLGLYPTVNVAYQSRNFPVSIHSPKFLDYKAKHE